MRLLVFVLVSVCFLRCHSADSQAQQDLFTDSYSSTTLTNYSTQHVYALREAILAGETRHRAVFRKLRQSADSLLRVPLYSVMQKTVLPPNGDKHHYVSFAPYWWPDSTKADGLPWIRKDGKVNPITKDANTDDLAKDRAFRNIETLAWAAFLSSDRRYADRAVAQLNTWFVNPATRMHPSLNYAQGIPGVNDGRCFGIIEMVGLQAIVTALELLAAEEWLPTATAAGMRSWLADFNHWLLTDPLGIEEGSRQNNHGTWYDVLVVTLSRYLGENDRARMILEAAKAERIASQLLPNGGQPHELARTKTINYSTMNLRAMTRLAWHGRQLGVDLWSFATPDGRSIPQAYAFLKPYFFEDKPWPYPQLGNVESRIKKSRALFYEAGALLNVPEFCQLQQKHAVPARSFVALLNRCR